MVSEYQPEGGRRREFEAAWVEWLPAIAWQHYCCATFPFDLSVKRADTYFQSFLNQLEQTTRGRVACLSVRENRSRWTGERVREHFHFVLRGEEPVDKELLKKIWCKVIGRRHHPEEKSMQADPFEASRNGLEYIVKSCHAHDAPFPERHNLEFFVARPKCEGSHQMRQSVKRLRKREKQRTTSAQIRATEPQQKFA